MQRSAQINSCALHRDCPGQQVTMPSTPPSGRGVPEQHTSAPTLQLLLPACGKWPATEEGQQSLGDVCHMTVT